MRFFNKNKKQNNSNNITVSKTDLELYTQHVIKSVFPNGDPSFFTPSYKTTSSKQATSTPYKSSIWVYVACRAITTNLAPIERGLDIKKSDEVEIIKEHALLDLLEAPNPLMDGPTFMEHVLLHMLLPTASTKGGQCFILTESLTNKPVNLKNGDIPKEMYPFSDEFIKPILDKSDGITLLGWEYKPYSGKDSILYKPEEVIRINFVDPSNVLLGQCPLFAGLDGIRQDFKAQSLNERFFDNNASLGGVLETDAELGGAVGRELRESFEERYAGQENAGKVALLHSGVKYNMFKQTHQDMQFLEQRKWTREEVLSAYGVSKFNAGIYEDLNFATAKVANKAFWENTLVPIDKRVLRAFTKQWIKYIDGGKYQLVSDFTDVQALAPDLTEKLKQAKELASMLVPVKVINDRLQLGLAIEDYDWLDTSLVTSTLRPANLAMEAPLESDTNIDTNIDIDTDTDTPTKDSSINTVLEVYQRLAKEEERKEKTKNMYVNDVLKADEKKFQKVFNNFFREQRNQILDNIDDLLKETKSKRVNINKGLDVSDIDIDLLLNFKGAENKKLRKLLLPEYVSAMLKEASIVSAELNLTDDNNEWDVSSTSAKQVLKTRLKKVTSVNTTTFKATRSRISKTINQAVKDQLSFASTIKLIRKDVNKVYKGKVSAETVARTESNSIHSQTRMDIYTSNGIKKIRWFTIGDTKVRNTKDSDFPHDVLHDQVTDISKGFNNGETIMYPLDPRASAGNVINCRCYITAEA